MSRQGLIMTKPKRHHYLPEFYLRGFSRDGKRLFVYDIPSGKLRQQAPEGTGVEKYFYAVETEDDPKDAGAEQVLSLVEGLAAPAIEKARARESIGADGDDAIRAFVGFMAVRTPAARAVKRYLLDKLAREDLLTRLGSAEGWSEFAEQEPDAAREIGGVDGLKELLNSEDYTIDPGQNYVVSSRFEQALDLTNNLARFSMGFLHSPDNKAFITCDCPVLFAYPAGFTPDYESAELPDEAQVIAPLAQDLCAVFEMRDIDQQHFDVERETIRRFNLTIAAHGRRYVIGPDRRLVASLARSRGRIPLRRLVPDEVGRYLPDDLRDIN